MVYLMGRTFVHIRQQGAMQVLLCYKPLFFVSKIDSFLFVLLISVFVWWDIPARAD